MPRIGSVNIEEETICWCGLTSRFHHISSANRRDGKITVWYKCSDKHRTFMDVNYKAIKQKSPKKKKEKKNAKTKEAEMPTQ